LPGWSVGAVEGALDVAAPDVPLIIEGFCDVGGGVVGGEVVDVGGWEEFGERGREEEGDGEGGE
jgi:hypothetical protein